MAVLQMQRISICALKKDRKHILELLQQQGIMEVSDSAVDDSVFKKADVSVAESVFTKNIAAAKSALEVLNEYAPVKKSMFASLEGGTEFTPDQYDAFYDKHDEILRKINTINNLVKKSAECKAETLKLSGQLEALTPWLDLDVPFKCRSTAHVSFIAGTLPDAWTLEDIYTSLAEHSPVNVDIISTTRDQTCIFIACLRAAEDSVTEALRSIGFSQKLGDSKESPAEIAASLRQKLDDLEKQVADISEEISSYSIDRDDIEFFIDFDSMRLNKYDVISRLLQSDHVIILNGFVPATEAENLKVLLDSKFDVAIDISEPTEDDDVPIALKNNAFAEPVESIVEAYSMPAKGELDPTFMVSVFYYLLFGLMLSDAGYGLIMVIACSFILIKFKNMKQSNRNFFKLFLFCGISTTFWGAMFSSWFGDIVDVISNYRLSIPPVWFSTLDRPMKMLGVSMLIGLIHLYAGLGVKFYACVREGKIKDAIYDVIFWYGLLTGLVLLGLSTDMICGMLDTGFVLSADVGRIGGIIAAVFAVCIVFTGGRESKHPFKRLLKGAYSVYGITSYLSDILSYSRLLALGLATGVVCSVVNMMASMLASMTGGVLGVIIFIIVLILGHSLNFGLNALGAYVHTNRLQYVEFFGKFYGGDGRKFKPFSAETKYYNLSKGDNK